MKTDGTNVLLYSYQRPNLTEESILRALSWSGLSKLFVTVDGLRKTAGADETNWRSETISIIEKYASLESRIVPMIWNRNIGLTNHSVRSLEFCFGDSERLIQIEDDNLVTEVGFSFLAKLEHKSSIPEIRSAFNKSVNHVVGQNVEYRHSLFPIQWGTSINSVIFSKYCENWYNKRIDESIVKYRIFDLPGIDYVTKKRLHRFWSNYFNSAILSPRHGDVVMQYTVFSEGIFFQVPLEDQVEDLGALDNRGMNSRNGSHIIQNHVNAKVWATDQAFICPRCEIRNARIEPKLTRYLSNTIKRRSEKYLMKVQFRNQ